MPHKIEGGGQPQRRDHVGGNEKVELVEGSGDGPNMSEEGGSRRAYKFDKIAFTKNVRNSEIAFFANNSINEKRCHQRVNLIL